MTPKLEELIWEGRARFETRSFAIQHYNLIEVPADEFIIITGYDFQPANIVNDVGAGPADMYQGLHRIELISGGSYNSFFHKMSGQSDFIPNVTTQELRSSQLPFHSIRDLYIVCKKDIGIQLSIAPDMTGQNSGSFDTTLAKNVFKGATANIQDYQTYSALPNNVSILNNSVYSEAYAAGPVNNAAGTNFTFRDTTATQHRYNRAGTNLYSRDQGVRTMWTLVVNFVRVFSKPTGQLS
jgi:hypothetical protein